MPVFGATVNVINGGVECGSGATLPKTQYRYEYCKYFCKYFRIPPVENIKNISCANQKPFGNKANKNNYFPLLTELK